MSKNQKPLRQKVRVQGDVRYGLGAKLCLALGGFLITLVIAALFQAPPAQAVAGINEQLNYQARLLTSTGAVVPDGTYNMEFKIYQDGAGCEAGGSSPCGGTLKWTETRVSTDKVTVRNGYFSVQLGSITPFASNVDWNQDTLWLSINIGGTGSPSWDGEMLPFRRLAAAVYALNAKQLGGLDWSKFVQIAPTAVQTDGTTLSTLFLNKTGASGNIVQLQKNGSDVLTVANGGATAITTTTDSDSGLSVINASGASAFNIDTSNTNLITNNSIESGTTGWTARGASAISQSTAAKYDNNNSLRIITTAAANDGAKFAYSLSASTQYTFSIFVIGATGFSTLQIGYSADGSTDTSCLSAQTVATTYWKRFTCTFTTGAVSGSPYVYLKQTDATIRTFYADAAQLETAAAVTPFESGSASLSGNLVINGGQALASSLTSTLEINQRWGTGSNGVVIRGNGENDLFTNILNVVNFDNALSFMTINEATKSSTFSGGSSFFSTPALRALSAETGARSFDALGMAGQTADILNVRDSSSNVLFGVGATGILTSQNSANSTAAFKILNATAVPLFVADTTNSRAYIGNPTADTTGALLVLDTKNNAGDPTGVVGGMYYNSNTSKMRCFQGSAWVDCIPGLQGAYDAGNTVTAATGVNILFTMPEVATDPSFLVNLQCDTCSGSNGRFAVQDDGTDVFVINPGGGSATFVNLEDTTIAFEILNGSGVPLFTVDSTNSQIEIGDQTADGTGAILILDTKNTAADPTGVNGGMYYNSSLAKFRCFENSIWMDCVGLDATNFRVSPFYANDFLEFGNNGRLSFPPWQRGIIGTGPTDTTQTGDATHIGVERFVSGTTANSGMMILTTITTPATMLLAGGEACELIFRIPTTTNTTVRFGFHDSVSSANPVDGSYIEIVGTAINGEVANNSSVSAGTGSTIVANTWYRAKVAVNSGATATTFTLYNSSNSQLWTTTVTATHPTAGGREHGQGFVATNSSTSATNVLDVDYMSMWWDRAIVR